MGLTLKSSRRYRVSVGVLVAGGIAYVLICGGMILKWQRDSSRAEAEFREPSATQWHKDGVRFRVRLRHQKLGKKERYTITVHGRDHQVEYQRQAEFYTGALLSGGFVKAVQVDDDPELEIVVWGSLASGWTTKKCPGVEAAPGARKTGARRYKSIYDRRSFYLDFRDGTVSERPFCRASTRAKVLASRWAYSHLKTPVHILVIVSLATLGLLLPALIFFFLTRRK